MAGQDDRLRDAGQRQLASQRRGRRGERRDARRDVPGDAELVEAARLLAERAVDREVAGVQARDVIAALVRRAQLLDDLVEREVLRCRPAGRRPARGRARSAGTSEPAYTHTGHSAISRAAAQGQQIGRARARRR